LFYRCRLPKREQHVTKDDKWLACTSLSIPSWCFLQLLTGRHGEAACPSFCPPRRDLTGSVDSSAPTVETITQ